MDPIEDLVYLSSRMARLSGEDPQTGLRNLRFFLRDLSREIARAVKSGDDLLVVLVVSGPHDEPTEFADGLRNLLEDDVLLARIGSSTFALLTSGDTSIDDVIDTIDRETKADSFPPPVMRRLGPAELKNLVPWKIIQELAFTLRSRPHASSPRSGS